MKTRPGKHLDQATDIILCDKEMEDLIKQLVQKAQDSGACVTHLNRAISAVWQENAHNKIEFKEFTKKEEAFAKKVEKFLDHYETDLIKHKNMLHETTHIFFEKKDLYIVLCSMYGIFETENNITLKLVEKYGKEHGFKRAYPYGYSGDIQLLNNFILHHLYFSPDNNIPIYSKDYVGYYNSINSMHDFYSFSNQYVLSNYSTCRTAIMAIWLIKTFF